MTAQLEFGTISSLGEAKQLGEILCQCFNFAEWQPYFDCLGTDNIRLVRRTQQIVAGLGIYQMGQWFGGCSVPTGGLAAVGVVPEERGTGVATYLLTQTLKELHANDVPLSTLYASTSALYRQVGYEQAGNTCNFALPLSSITLRDRTLPIRRVDPAQHQVFHHLYHQRAQITNGNLARNQAIWQSIVQPQPPAAVYAYLVGSEAQPEGYVIFTQQTEAGRYHLLVRDLVALTPAAGRCLWTFFASHRSMAAEVRWRGAAIEPLLSLLSEQTYRVLLLERWLLRLINLPLALEKRGYPAGVVAELHLAVEDELLPENQGNFVLTVANGQGEVKTGGRGDLQLNIRGLAPLYTGLFTPQQLQSTGQLTATSNALATAAQIFAGSEPWLPDHF